VDYIDLESTEIELYNSFLKRLGEILPLERSLLYTLDSKQRWLIYKAASQKVDGLFWRCFSLDNDECIEVSSFITSTIMASFAVESTPLDHRIQELTGRKYALCLPFKIERKNRGLICLELTNNNLSDSQLELIKLQILFLEACIERNDFKEKLKKITERSLSFHNNISTVDHMTQYHDAVKFHLASIFDLVKGQSASLMLRHDNQVTFQITLDKDHVTTNGPRGKETSLEEWVLKNRIPYFVQNDENSKSIIMSLVSKEEALGTITIKTDPTDDLTESDRIMLGFGASHLASVIDNHKLLRDVQLEKNYIESILNSSPIGILITDMDGNISAMNQSAANCLNLKWKEFIVDSEGLRCPDFLIAILKNKSNVIWPVEIDLSRESNYGFQYLNVTAAEVCGENNMPVGFTIALQDVTKKKALEQEIERTNKLATLGAIAAGVAHEIRNPLMSLTLFLDQIHDNFVKNEEKNLLSTEERSLLEIALKQIDRLDKIVSALLDFSAKKEGKEGKYIDLNETMEEMIEFLRHQCEKSNIKIEMVCRTLPKTFIDEQKLKQALLNICLNAIQAMPSGGTLKVETSTPRKGSIKIAISDTGIGIPKENIEKVFSPFFSTKENGIGIGLSITEKIITELGGKINVSSRVGQGTELIILFT